jgi:hypothetical protein
LEATVSLLASVSGSPRTFHGGCLSRQSSTALDFWQRRVLAHAQRSRPASSVRRTCALPLGGARKLR